MELRIVVSELDPKTHRIMKSIVTYISTTYDVRPGLMDLEGAIFDDVNMELCNKIVDDVMTKFRRHLKYIEVMCF
jgi:hypothetical protein